MNMRDEFECVMREQREIARAHGRAVRSAHTIYGLAACRKDPELSRDHRR